jgi:ABC transporter
VGLRERADDRVAKYSMGMRQRLGIAACLIANPELLILDEPMNGLDPAGMLEFRELIRSLVTEGRTVVLSSHLLDEVEKTCDAIAIVDRDNVVLHGRIDDLTADAAATLQLECSDPARAAVMLRLSDDVENVRKADDALVVRLASDDPARRDRADRARPARGRLRALPAAARPRLTRAALPCDHFATGRKRHERRRHPYTPTVPAALDLGRGSEARHSARADGGNDAVDGRRHARDSGDPRRLARHRPGSSQADRRSPALRRRHVLADAAGDRCRDPDWRNRGSGATSPAASSANSW